MLVAGIEAAGYEPGADVAIAMDPATSELYRGRGYVLEHEGRTLSAAELTDYWAELVARYPIVSIEDGMDEEDWAGWRTLTERLGERAAARRRRSVRDEHRASAARHRRGRGELDSDQGQPDRDAVGDAGRDRAWRARPGIPRS